MGNDEWLNNQNDAAKVDLQTLKTTHRHRAVGDACDTGLEEVTTAVKTLSKATKKVGPAKKRS